MSLIMHINGWPGTGKLTIARHLADRLPARLVDNHALLGPAQAIHPHGSLEFSEPRFRAGRSYVASTAPSTHDEGAQSTKYRRLCTSAYRKMALFDCQADQIARLAQALRALA